MYHLTHASTIYLCMYELSVLHYMINALYNECINCTYLAVYSLCMNVPISYKIMFNIIFSMVVVNRRIKVYFYFSIYIYI